MVLQVNDVMITHRDSRFFLLFLFIYNFIGQSDFSSLTTIMYNSGNSDNGEIRLFTSIDHITLEYDDRIKLVFTPNNPALIPVVEDVGEYIRDTVIVNIIDNDC